MMILYCIRQCWYHRYPCGIPGVMISKCTRPTIDRIWNTIPCVEQYSKSYLEKSSSKWMSKGSIWRLFTVADKYSSSATCGDVCRNTCFHGYRKLVLSPVSGVDSNARPSPLRYKSPSRTIPLNGYMFSHGLGGGVEIFFVTYCMLIHVFLMDTKC